MYKTSHTLASLLFIFFSLSSSLSPSTHYTASRSHNKSPLTESFFNWLKDFYLNNPDTEEEKIVCRQEVALKKIGQQQASKPRRQSYQEIKKWQEKGDLRLCNNSEVLHIPVPGKDSVPAVFHNRNSEELVVVAGGFGDCKECFVPLLWVFPDKDILFFDYQGHGLESKVTGLAKKLGLSFNPKKTTFGLSEENEIIAVTQEIIKRKSDGYKKVIGAGFCFGTGMMLKAQEKKALFDCFIFDGCWPSSTSLIERMVNNPCLLNNPRCYKKNWKTRLLNLCPLRKCFKFFCEKMLCKQTLDKKIDSLKMLSKSTVPTLFFHSQQDFLISNYDFEKILNTQQGKEFFAVFTPNKHLANLTGGKPEELRKYIFKSFANLFLRYGCQDILKIIENPDLYGNILNEILAKESLSSDSLHSDFSRNHLS